LQKVKTCAVSLFHIQGWLHRRKKYSNHAKLAAYRAILNNTIVGYETNCDEKVACKIKKFVISQQPFIYQKELEISVLYVNKLIILVVT